MRRFFAGVDSCWILFGSSERTLDMFTVFGLHSVGIFGMLFRSVDGEMNTFGEVVVLSIQGIKTFAFKAHSLNFTFLLALMSHWHFHHWLVSISTTGRWQR